MAINNKTLISDKNFCTFNFCQSTKAFTQKVGNETASSKMEESI